MRGLDVRVRGLVHIYRSDGQDVAALSGVHLDLAASETLALLGPSGAGKSTLLMLLAGLDRPTAGTITVGSDRLDQLSVADIDKLRGRALGLVLQGGAANLIPHLTLRENIELAQVEERDDVPTARTLTSWVGLDEAEAGLMPHQASPAQTQLAALCVGAASAPGLLLADEPTASLGVDETGRVIDALHRLNTEIGSTVLTVTHDPVLARSMQRTVTIRDGRVGGQAEAGVDIAIIAPDGSLPLPDAVLEDWPPGATVQVANEASGEDRHLVVRRWQAGSPE
ncbi:ABC transporter ATP-binding protein [Demetria terragena]|uniref:ABC transporter ATP-binding protein n=1 Tax=Demetria terragena TaxID=63959 RepID=UPI0003747F04|nr:ABC transporter ATP-binding protein [Demetria terragena]